MVSLFRSPAELASSFSFAQSFLLVSSKIVLTGLFFTKDIKEASITTFLILENAVLIFHFIFGSRKVNKDWP